MSSTRRAFGGFLFTGIDMLLSKGISFVATFLLARLLGPENFGIVGLITVFITLGNVFVDSGLTSSIIRSKNIDDLDLSTIFITNLAVSAFVYLVIFIIAPFISAFYSQPSLTTIIRVYGLSFLIVGFSVVQTACTVRNLKFKKLLIINLPSNIIGAIVGFILAFAGYGVWAIIFMLLSTQFSYAILIWLNTEWKPSFRFSSEKLKLHFSFGSRLMLSGVINTFFENLYFVLIGKFFSIKVNGYYERSKTLNEYPVIMLSTVINKVTYPMLAKVQDDKIRIGLVFRKLIQVSFFIVAPVMLCACAVAEPLFKLILGDEWLPAVPFFQILCFSSILYPIHSFNINILQVLGRSDLFLRLEIFKKILIIIIIAITINFGLTALLIGSVITSYLSLAINGFYSEKLMGYSFKMQLNDILPIMISSSAVMLLVYLYSQNLSDHGLLVQVLLPFFLGLGLYALVSFLVKPQAFRE